tara:strand:+ start:212 stop:358 length:147 start_codon:yes stop_codon:yes gene_type:complete
MAKPVTRKVIHFDDFGLVKSIQDYANKNYNGNFTKAVNELAKAGLNKG